MRLLSRVIKASNLVVLEPTKVNAGTQAYGVPRLVEVEADSELSDGNLGEQPLSSHKMREEADRIIKETEVMVQGLIDGARQKATTILEEAKVTAEQIQQQAHDEIEQAIKEGFDNGYQEGLKVGQEEGLEACQETRLSAQKELEEAQKERQAIIKASEQEILELALAIANKIVGYEVEANTDAIIKIVHSALQKVTDRQDLIIKVSPFDLNKVIALETEIYREFQGIKKLKIIGDDYIQQGGCEIETASGSVDARIETQLARIKEVIMGVM